MRKKRIITKSYFKKKSLCDTCIIKCSECLDGDTFVIECYYYKKKGNK
jgi:hypothetical protein